MGLGLFVNEMEINWIWQG